MSWLTDRILAYVSGAIALACLSAAGWLYFSKVLLERDLAQCNEAKASLESSLREQNRAITLLNETTVAARQKAASAVAAAEDMGRARQDEIDALQGRILKASERTCAPALAEIRRLLK